MDTPTFKQITVETIVNAPVDKVWKYWINPEHVVKWNSASDDWHTPTAKNDLRDGGEFMYRMEAKDGSFGFDFGGKYDNIKTKELITYTMGDGRKVRVEFKPEGNKTRVTETFDAEETNSLELQKTGWQNIMDNFRKYTEAN